MKVQTRATLEQKMIPIKKAIPYNQKKKKKNQKQHDLEFIVDRNIQPARAKFIS